MNNKIQVFKNSDYNVRTQMVNNEVWFCLVDVANILKITSYRKTADNLRNSQRCIFNIQPQGDTIFINESGLYRILLRSRKKEAESFQVWVEDEVLPTIRKTGSYQVEKPKTPLELLKIAVSELEAKEKENKLLADTNKELANRDLEVKTQKDYKWKKQVVQNDRGRAINYYVNKYFFNGSYQEAHNKAKDIYRQSTGYNLPNKAILMSLEQKKDYLSWLSRYQQKEA